MPKPLLSIEMNQQGDVICTNISFMSKMKVKTVLEVLNPIVIGLAKALEEDPDAEMDSFKMLDQTSEVNSQQDPSGMTAGREGASNG